MCGVTKVDRYARIIGAAKMGEISAKVQTICLKWYEHVMRRGEYVPLFHRRWFMIQNNQLVYRKRTKDNLTVMEEDLRLCTVRPLIEIDRRFCFEVLSPSRWVVVSVIVECDAQLQT